MRSRIVLYGLLVGCAALATLIYRHLFEGETIRMADLRMLIVAIPLGALLMWFRLDGIRQVRSEARHKERERP